MIHLIAFSGVKTDSAANEAVPAIADLTVTRTANGNQYLLPWDAQIIAAIVYNDTVTRARLNFPSYRDVGLPEIVPVNQLAEPSADYELCMWGMNGPRVKKTEELGADMTNGVSTVDVGHVGVWLSDGITPVPGGRKFSVRGTAAQTLVASQWTAAPIALDQTLPFGRYGVIGAHVVCNDGVLARLAFPNNMMFRPGFPTGETVIINDYGQHFRAGKLGLLGTFDQTAPPQLEILGGTAGAETPAIVLDLVEMRG